MGHWFEHFFMVPNQSKSWITVQNSNDHFNWDGLKHIFLYCFPRVLMSWPWPWANLPIGNSSQKTGLFCLFTCHCCFFLLTTLFPVTVLRDKQCCSGCKRFKSWRMILQFCHKQINFQSILRLVQPKIALIMIQWMQMRLFLPEGFPKTWFIQNGALSDQYHLDNEFISMGQSRADPES